MTYAEMIDRLLWIARAKPGEPMPDWLGGSTNNWGPPLSELAQEALKYLSPIEPKK